jgi:hypothetical protein
LSINLTGCNSDENNTPIIEYGNIEDANKEMKNYTNADWLYDNYFGEYGLPNEIKVDLMPALMMVANGFALQFATGKDVNSSISQLSNKMQLLAYSGGMTTAVQDMLNNLDAGNIYGLKEKKKKNIYNHTRIISAEAKRNIDQSDKLDKKFIQNQIDTVEKYSLPYKLEGFETKYVIDVMSFQKCGLLDLDCFTDDEDEPKRHTGIDGWIWWEADFTWTNGAKGFGHMGLVTNVNSSRKHIIDASPIEGGRKAGVVRHRNGLNSWANNGGWSRVEGHWFTGWGQNHPTRKMVVRNAISMLGKPYNNVFFKGKRSNDAAYCSQLVWNSFKKEKQDLDKDQGYIVLPRDITGHHDVAKFNSSNL